MAGRVEADVVVVGAGLVGLAAAWRLRQAGCGVVVLEARDRVGGRVLNHHLGDGLVVDVGGQFTGPAQRHILGLAAELGVATVPIFTSGLTVLELAGRRRAYRRVPRANPAQLADAGRAITALDRMARRVQPQAPWDAKGAGAADGRTLADWARRNVRTRLGRFAIEAFSEGVLACDLESPGLHRFYHPFLDENEVRDASGIIDLIRQYERAAAKASGSDEARRLIAERAKVQPFALSLAWEFPDGGAGHPGLPARDRALSRRCRGSEGRLLRGRRGC